MSKKQKKKTIKPEAYYRHDIAGVWVYLEKDGNELLLTQQPITNPRDQEAVKEWLEAG